MNIAENKYAILGVLGAIILVIGRLHVNVPQIYYIVGSFLLLITSIYYKLVYFIALEIILIAGHTAILVHLGPYIQLALPIFLCLQLAIFYLMIGKGNNLILLIGVVGIALLSLGFSYHQQWIFFFGSFFISFYAYYEGYKGRSISYIWAVLNTFFAIIALYELSVKYGLLLWLK